MTTGFVPIKDGVNIFYKDWGSGQPVVFSHGWPLTGDIWDDQMMLVANNGFRGIAQDRRGGGRSGQSWDGNDLDTYADDLGTLLDTLRGDSRGARCRPFAVLPGPQRHVLRREPSWFESLAGATGS